MWMEVEAEIRALGTADRQTSTRSDERSEASELCRAVCDRHTNCTLYNCPDNTFFSHCEHVSQCEAISFSSDCFVAMTRLQTNETPSATRGTSLSCPLFSRERNTASVQRCPKCMPISALDWNVIFAISDGRTFSITHSYFADGSSAGSS
jgi:hypothetical protein